MLEARHSLTCDPRRDLVLLELSGFYTVAQVEQLHDAIRRCQTQLRCAPNRHLTLVDAAGMKIQTQDVVAAFLRMATDPETMSRRMAVVVGSSLARLQTQRATSRPDVALFREHEEATSWLFADAA